MPVGGRHGWWGRSRAAAGHSIARHNIARLVDSPNERVLVIFPSVAAGIPFPGLQEILVTIGFLAAFLLARRWFFSRFKPVLNLPHTGGH